MPDIKEVIEEVTNEFMEELEERIKKIDVDNESIIRHTVRESGERE